MDKNPYLPNGMTRDSYRQFLVERIDSIQDELSELAADDYSPTENEIDLHEEYVSNLIYEMEHCEQDLRFLDSDAEWPH